jgi:predicted metalloprotease with PDZ domain
MNLHSPQLGQFGVTTALLVCLGAAQAGASHVRYTISLANPQQHLVKVTMEIPASRESHELQLPVWNALYQVRDFSQYMNWIHAETASGQALELTQLNQSRWRIGGAQHGARVVYEMFSDDPGSYGAQLNSHHAFFNLAEILLYADDLRNEKAEMDIRDLPANWKIVTSLSQEGRLYIAESYDRLVDSPVEVGTFKERDFAGACGRYRVILDGGSNPDKPDTNGKSDRILNRLIPPLERIVSLATEWMDDCPFESYMFIYHASDSPEGGGMEHAYSTAITLPAKDFEETSDRLLGFSAHEFFHLWNVKRIRPRSLEPVDYTKENYTTALWFSEGVDSTVGEYLCLRAHVFDEAGYLRHLSEEITEFENRPAHRTQSVEHSSLDAWLEKYAYYGLPVRSISYYTKGELLGMLLDLKMREASDDEASLRDLFRWMNAHYPKAGKFFADSEAVREAAETVSHAPFEEFFQKYVSGTEEIPWDKFFARVGLRVVESDIALADPGFEAVVKFDQPPVVVEVEPGSEAEHAGVKRGDVIVRVNGREVGREFDRAIANLGPGEVLRISMRRAGMKHELEWRLGSRKQAAFQLGDVPGVTSIQRARRAAWLFDQGKKNPR